MGKKLSVQAKHLYALLKRYLKEKRLAAAVILGVSGVLLLMLSTLGSSGNQADAEPVTVKETVDTAALEEKLESLLAKVEGVGAVKVMVTMENGGEQVMARNSESAGDSGETGKSWKENSEYAVVDGKTVLLKTTEPTVRGVAVVCEGGNSPQVRSRVSSTVTAVLGIHSNRVSVVCMENENG